MYIPRKQFSSVFEAIDSNKALIIYGPRQVGKSTLIQKIADQLQIQRKQVVILDLEDPDNIELLENSLSVRLIEQNFAGIDCLIIDEAQKYQNIGKFIKLVVDHLPQIKVIATGSSSFELANRTAEPLTGRKYEFTIYPISLEELKGVQNPIEIRKNLENYLLYGMYPEILNSTNKIQDLQSLSSSYLYKDTLNYDTNLDESVLRKLLQLLAFQVGSEVSFNELATQLGISQPTVEKYIGALEKAFIIFTLSSLSKNPRKEISKKKKIYFWDNGIRNGVIKAFNPVHLRNDLGLLWENFCVMERIKYLEYNHTSKNYYFWRNYNQFEVDWVEESSGNYTAFEFKYNPKKIPKLPPTYSESYPKTNFKVISPKNFWDLLENKFE